MQLHQSTKCLHSSSSAKSRPTTWRCENQQIVEKWQSQGVHRRCRDCQHTGIRQTQHLEQIGGDWWELFTVAVIAKYSLSINAFLRITTQQAPRNLSSINNLNEEAAERKVISVLFLSLGTAGRKSVTDVFPGMRVATVTLQELRTNCDEAFSKPRNRTLGRFKFFSRKQKEKGTLRHFWHPVTGLAAKCEFGEQTESLVMETFFQNMNNKTVRERLCTELKADPQKVFGFAVA